MKAPRTKWISSIIIAKVFICALANAQEGAPGVAARESGDISPQREGFESPIARHGAGENSAKMWIIPDAYQIKNICSEFGGLQRKDARRRGGLGGKFHAVGTLDVPDDAGGEVQATLVEVLINFCSTADTMPPDVWLKKVANFIEVVRANEECVACQRFVVPKIVSDEFKSYSVLLVPSSEWIHGSVTDVSELHGAFVRFGASIGEGHLAIWFENQDGAPDVARSKYYCDLLNLNYNDGPYVVTSEQPLHELVQGSEVVVIKLEGLSSSRAVKVLNLLEQDLRMGRAPKSESLLFEEIKQRALGVAERHGEGLVKIVQTLFSD